MQQPSQFVCPNCGRVNRGSARFCAYCGAVSASQASAGGAQLSVPTLVPNIHLHGRYVILRVVGQGGFGALYEAKDLQQNGLVVAVKESLQSQGILAFPIEFSALRSLRHPNLPRYYDVFEESGRAYLVMEFISGQSLKDVIVKQNGPLLESQVMGYAIQVCDALRYLHSQHPPILHRDIKPDNIRLTPEGLVKLVDFGLMKQGTGSTQTIFAGGTRGFAPIEQYPTIPPMHTDRRSDVYSLAATLFCLLTANLPTPSPERWQMQQQNHIDPQPTIQSINPRVSRGVSQAVKTAMELMPDQRFPDVAAFKHALLGIAMSHQRQSSVAPQISPTMLQSSGNWRRGLRLLGWVFAVIAILGVIGMGALVSLQAISSRSPTMAAPITIVSRSLATPTSIPANDEMAINQLINAESESVVAQDINRLQQIWTNDGVVTDVNRTPNITNDDKTWRGWPAIRDRYVNIVFPSNPSIVVYTNIRVNFSGDKATAVSDLLVDGRNLKDNNKWTFSKVDGIWKMTSMTFNLASP